MQKRAELEQAKKKHVPSMKVVKTVKMKLDLPSFCGFESSSSVGWHLVGEFLDNGENGDEILRIGIN